MLQVFENNSLRAGARAKLKHLLATEDEVYYPFELELLSVRLDQSGPQARLRQIAETADSYASRWL